MDTVSPVVTDAFRLLCRDLYEHLGEAECLARQCTEWCDQDMDTVRKLIPDLVTVIRGLVLEHEVTPSGGCRTCPSAWPCPVVTTIHALVKDPEREFVALVRRAHEEASNR